MKFLMAGIINSIADFIGDAISNFSITLDTVFYIGIGFQTLMVIFYLIKSHYAYEGRLERSLDGLSKWLYYHKTIDSSNLIEFNNRMKKTPKLLRHHWQQYMLYRENLPSHYMSTYNCIEKPLHTSSYNSNLKNLMNINITIIFLTFIFGFAIVGGTFDAATALQSAIVPMIICVLNTLFLMLLRSMQNFNLSSLYFNFNMFQRYIDKASATLPEYVDFEILFTKKEISRGIPVLNEYLEKRTRQEQEELEKARLNAVEHEKYDFTSSGMDGALVLDRAIKETEVYLNARQRLLYEIQQLESEIDSLKRNYENTSKEYQRKMQASKENVERLRKQQEETTNRIESNYIKKQQGDEIKKQETLEKEQDDATIRFNQQITSLQSEIDKRRIDLEDRKNYVQVAMLAEYQTFSNKLYDIISNDIQAKVDAEKQEIINEKELLAEEVANKNLFIENQDRELNELKQVISNANIELGDHGQYYNEELRKEEQKVKLGLHNQAVAAPVVEDKVEEIPEPVENTEQEPEVVVQESENIEIPEYTEQEPEYVETTEYPENLQEYGEPEAQVNEMVEENVGYYDDKGYYWYPNGTYYDDQNYYHDLEGNVMDSEGNIIKTAEEVMLEQQQEEAQENVVEDELAGLDYTEEPTVQEEVVKQDEIQEEQIKVPEVEEKGPKLEELQKPNVEEETEEKPEAEEKASEETKGKRGRPKKQDVEIDEKPKGKRGRPKGSIKVQNTPKVTAGKRGRPKGSTKVEQQPKTAGAGKRGRPKGTTKVEKEPKQVSTGKRGRPKGSTKVEKEPKKVGTGKRGRPKGSAKVTEELKLINEQIREEQKKLLEEQKQLNKQLSETITKIDGEGKKNSDKPEGQE